jgi:hypothetical protein
LLKRLRLGKCIGYFDERIGRRGHVLLGLGADLFLIGVEVLKIADEQTAHQRDDGQALGVGEHPIGLAEKPAEPAPPTLVFRNEFAVRRNLVRVIPCHGRAPDFGSERYNNQ